MPYQIGLAKTDITPPVGIHLAGYANRLDPSTGVYLPLTATAIAISDDQNKALIVGAEILGFYEHAHRVRDRISTLTGLKPHQILLGGSHTHCGPVLRAVDKERHGTIDTGYIDALFEKVAQCAQQAWQNRTPGELKYGTGTCDFAINRRMPDANGVMQMRPNPNGPVDHTVSVLAIESPQGQKRGVLFSYACHPTSRGGLLIGGDYVGFALQHLEQTIPGLTSGFLLGCAGDQKPRPVDPSASNFDQRDIDQVATIGKQLGEAVHAVLNAPMSPVDGPLTIAHKIITLETEPIDWHMVQEHLIDERPFMRNWAQHFQTLRDNALPIETQIPFEVQTLKWGTALALVTLSGEISVEYALRLKNELHPTFAHACVVAYTNGLMGYVPAHRQIPEGGYEVWANQFHLKRTGPYIANTEDLICQTAHQLLST